jgi:Aspartyl/Asparaginyl beta-hydroxylase
MTATASPTWAKGHDVKRLKEITAIFKQHDAGMIHGAFGRYSEVDLVADLERCAVAFDNSLEWACVARNIRQRQSVKDFTGDTRLVLDEGSWVVSRMAWTTPRGREEVREYALDGGGESCPLAVWVWQEHESERGLVRDLDLAAVKISAASEMRGLYVREPQASGGALFAEEHHWPVYPAEQRLTLGTLGIQLPTGSAEALVDAVKDLDFAQHYSSYNKGETWTALALRGFFDEPERIEKPAEMSKKWKREHAPDMGNEPRDTPLREQLAAAEPLLAAIPCAAFERIRLMRLAPGGGELTRHADITDLQAGAEPGRIVRIHIPLISNPDVVFHGWDLNGRKHRLVMEPGRAYYLDQRKPHTAINNGSTERIHLVADVVASVETCRLLAEAEEAPHV